MFQAQLQPSFRPLPPPPFTGQLMKETHSWFTEWHARYFICEEGFLTWWFTEADSKKDVAPNGRLELWALKVRRVPPDSKQFQVAVGSSTGTIYDFASSSSGLTSSWL